MWQRGQHLQCQLLAEEMKHIRAFEQLYIDTSEEHIAIVVTCVNKY